MARMPSPGSRPWLRWALVAVVVVLVLAGGAVAFVLAHSPGNVSHPDVEFTARPRRRRQEPPPKRKVVVDNFEWPRYGYDAGRTRDFVAPRSLAPPFRVGWSFEDYALLEFPPVIYGHTLFQMDDVASAKAIDARTGHKLWETKVGTLAAASPRFGAAAGPGVRSRALEEPRPRPDPRERPVRGAVDEDRPDRVEPPGSGGHRVLSDRLGRLGVLRRSERERCIR